jgi:hypothetical protein
MPFTALLHGTAPAPAAARIRRPPLGVRVRAHVQGLELTRRLAAGADPSLDPALAARAARLTSPRERRATVERLERVLRDAEAPPFALSAAAPLQRDAILAARPFLVGLVDDLRTTEDPRPTGLARAELLLTDGCGPLYAPSPPGTLAGLVFRARDAV